MWARVLVAAATVPSMASYPLTIALSAFLLFLVQPVVAKQILPWFGGSASVWTTCMLFFQLVLVAGYGYSDLLVRKLTLRRQVLVHGALVAASLVALPIVAPAGLKPHDASNPILRILLLLFLTVGLPYFVLSTTGPLIQSWYARAVPGTRVYRLYAVSNGASLGALASYPVLVEPNATARWQSVGWSVAYALFAATLGATAWVTIVRARRCGDGHDGTGGAADRVQGDSFGGRAPSRGQAAMWFVLAMLGSTLLLAVTAQLTQEVAAVPFLWVLPLAIYLMSFVLAFDGSGWYWRRTYVTLSAGLVVAMLAAALPWKERPFLELEYALPLYGVGLFVTCMFCHGELAARKPAPRHLTRFYFVVALGGAAGGLFVGVLAPLLFSSYLEIPLALCAAAGMLYVAIQDKLRFVGAAALLVAVALATVSERGLRAQAVARARSFYGSLRVTAAGTDERGDVRLRLAHGVTLHGEQFRAPERRRAATSYYGETSGIGRTVLALGDRPDAPLRVGIVGMGVATLATYGRTGDTYRFYEIDAEVVRLARRHFSYLTESAATIHVILGDGRLSLEREPPQAYDLLVVDAFSSDSIPVHLLTLEAMRAYVRHLAADGAIAFHVSNRYLELAPLVRLLGESARLDTLNVRDEPPEGSGALRSDWVIGTRNRALLKRLTSDEAAKVIPPRDDLRPWTDDYSNLLRVLKSGRGGGTTP